MTKRKGNARTVDNEQDNQLARFDEQLKNMFELQKKTYDQVQKTNGRVSSLEIWRAYLVGGGIVIITLIGWLIQIKTNG